LEPFGLVTITSTTPAVWAGLTVIRALSFTTVNHEVGSSRTSPRWCRSCRRR
jgi:hypothetical protein